MERATAAQLQLRRWDMRAILRRIVRHLEKGLADRGGRICPIRRVPSLNARQPLQPIIIGAVQGHHI